MKKLPKSAKTVLAVFALFLLTLKAAGCAWAPGSEEAAAADAQTQVEQTPPLIALTFDDGPRYSTTTALLDGLSQRGVQATFFLIGKQIAGNEDLVRRMDAEGHQIGIHTYDHVLLTGLNRTDFDAQVDKTRQLLINILGHDGFALRPPYGIQDEAVRAMAECPIILWSIDPEDWGDKDADRVTAHILEQARDGSVVLLHDIYPTSVEAALRVVDALHQQGYCFVTIDQLFAERGIELEAGKVYWNGYP